MIGPSPCYINQGDYCGGFERNDIEALLNTMAHNYLAWASTMAPAIMGAPDKPELGAELADRFCRTDPDIVQQFARLIFLPDHRAQLPRLHAPALILQCSDDMIAPVAVGRYMHRTMPGSTLEIIQNVGHCPHMSQPDKTAEALDAFLISQGLERA